MIFRKTYVFHTFILFFYFTSCVSNKNREFNKFEAEKLVKIISAYPQITQINFTFKSQKKYIVNNEDYTTPSEVQNKYLISDYDWVALNNIIDEYTIQPIVILNNEYLFITDSYNGEFTGYWYTERKVQNIIYSTDFISFNKYYIKNAEKIEKNWYKVLGSW